MYYDTEKNVAVSDADMKRRGLLSMSPADLARAGFHQLRIEKPEYDPATQGLEPDGSPCPGEGSPAVYIQPMRVYDLMGRWKEAKKTEATARRWARETGGIILPDGTSVLTGIDDQNRISTALQGMKDNGMAEVDFKSASGWVKLTLEELQNIAGVIAVHVQACFSNERRLHGAIDACATLGELNAIDLEEGWPEYRMPAEDLPMESE